MLVELWLYMLVIDLVEDKIEVVDKLVVVADKFEIAVVDKFVNVIGKFVVDKCVIVISIDTFEVVAVIAVVTVIVIVVDKLVVVHKFVAQVAVVHSELFFLIFKKF